MAIYGFLQKDIAQGAKQIVQQRPPGQWSHPPVSIYARTWIVKLPSGGIPGLTQNDAPANDVPGEAECDSYLIDTNGELVADTNSVDGQPAKLTVYNLSESTIAENTDENGDPVDTYMIVSQFGDKAIASPAGGGGGTELDVLTEIKEGTAQGQLCAEKKRIRVEVLSPDPAPSDTCIDICELIKCCDTLVSQPDECQADPCDPCIFYDMANVRIQDGQGSYVNSGPVERIGTCSWRVQMETTPGGNPAGEAAWNHNNITPNWAYDFNGSFRSYTYRSDPYYATDGCTLELWLKPQSGDGISWLMDATGELTDEAILPLGSESVPDSPVALLQQACGCQGKDALALIRRWGKEKSMAQIDKLMNLLILGAARQGKVVDRDELLIALKRVIDDLQQ